jgi:hypothetical protein
LYVLQVWQHSTVFELAGQDRSGLLADVLQLLTHNGCNVGSAAVWTYSRRAAFVVSVVEGCGQPIRDVGKLARLKQLLHQMMDEGGNGIVTAQAVKGLIHYERRLHQLLLKEEEKEWLRTKDHILARLQLRNDNCSCSCHQQQASGSVQQLSSNGSAGLGFPNGRSNSSSSLSNGLQQQQQQVQQPGLSGSLGGACCCCQLEQQAERHIVHSEVPPPGTVTPPHHTPSSSAGTLEELTEADRLLISPKFSKPYVTIQHYCHLNYWLVTIRCKDRNKLFFDTVCTLSDLNYDVYHGAIDQVGAAMLLAVLSGQHPAGLCLYRAVPARHASAACAWHAAGWNGAQVCIFVWQVGPACITCGALLSSLCNGSSVNPFYSTLTHCPAAGASTGG